MKNILITGITGTLGTMVTKSLLEKGYRISGLSRDEQKQKTFKYRNDVELFIGDVAQVECVNRAVRRSDTILHFAAMKCIDVCENNVNETHRSNVIGTKNILQAAKKVNARVIFTSTDKAVEPKNTYGFTKALAERMVLAFGEGNIVCRYGNVLGSRGSVLQMFKDSIIKDNIINLTDYNMSRFWWTQENAADFVIDIAHKDKPGLYIPQIKSAYVLKLAQAIAEYYNKKPCLNLIGMNPVEKLHECLAIAQETDKNKNIYSNDLDYLMTDVELKNMINPYLEKL